MEELLRLPLDAGEAECLALATEVGADLVLLDDRAAVSVADEWGLASYGVLGVLLAAKQRGLLADIAPIIHRLRDEVGFWLTDDLVGRVLRVAGEAS